MKEKTCIGSTCTHGNFGAATEESDEPFSLVAFDGICGLSLLQMAEGPAFNVLDCMGRDKVLRSNLFLVFFSSADAEESEIAFREFKAERVVSELFFQPVSIPRYSQVGMDDVPIRNERLDLCNQKLCQVAVDTGTSLMAGRRRRMA